MVGPDLVSVGASAQIDYLIESIPTPTAKVKENYQALTVVVDGRITSGIKVRETDRDLVLRDVEDREVAIPLELIEDRKEAGSLMPSGLADGLSRAANCATWSAFCPNWARSALTPPTRCALRGAGQRWFRPPKSRRDSMPAASMPWSLLPRSRRWTSVYSRVSGQLPLDSVPTVASRSSDAGWRVVCCQVDVANAGQLGLSITGPVEKIWLDDQPLPQGDAARHADRRHPRHHGRFGCQSHRRAAL